MIIPARNEADVVGRAIRSLLQQTGPQKIHIFLVDDASTDGTAQAARAAAIAKDQTQNLTIVPGSPLPSGWSGKLWAMQQGIEQAGKTAPDFFLLTDADIEHAPDSLATLVSIAHAGPYDMASFMVKLHCQSVAEKLLIPAFVYFFFKLYPPAWISNPRRSEAGAAGDAFSYVPLRWKKPVAFRPFGKKSSMTARSRRASSTMADACGLALPPPRAASVPMKAFPG